MNSTTIDEARLATPAAVPRARSAGRLFFIDNIRVFLTVLVILHHLMAIYADSGSWLYNEGRQDEITFALGAWFAAANQAYFMGLFLLISAYFVPGSYDRKGPALFLKDRLIRLGIPLVLYGWLVRPVFVYLAFVRPEGTAVSFWSWYRFGYFQNYGIIGGGPLWFIEALLIYSAVYVLWRLATRSRPVAAQVARPFPGNLTIALVALAMALASFVVRIWFPINESFRPLNLQLANFVQYTTLFVFGLVAYRRDWLLNMPARTGKLWLGVGLGLIILYPALAILSGAAENSEPFMGGWQWQSLLTATWESFTCLGMCLGLVYLFRSRWDSHGRVAAMLARNAYGAYLIHEPVVTLLALAAAGVALYPLLKFGLGALIAVPLSFGLGALLRRLPYADRVL